MKVVGRKRLAPVHSLALAVKLPLCCSSEQDQKQKKCPVNKSSRTQTLLVILQDTASFIVSRRSDGAS